MSIRNKWLVFNKHTTKHRLLDHAKQTSIDKGILKVGGSDVTVCIRVLYAWDSLNDWVFQEAGNVDSDQLSNRTEKVGIMFVY